MKKLAIFLRGVNVKGTRMKMEELKKALESAGYNDVKTILASGNAAVTANDDLSIDEHKTRIEKTLSEYFQYEAHAMLRTKEQIENIIKEAETHSVPDGYHHYIFLIEDKDLASEMHASFKKCSIAPKEEFIVGSYGVYWIVPKGYTLKSDFGSMTLGSKEYKSQITSRTIGTIEKVYKALM